MALVIMAICTVLFENLTQRYDKKSPGGKNISIFFFNVQTNEIFEIFKMFKNNS